jgi:hypothetical protein
MGCIKTDKHFLLQCFVLFTIVSVYLFFNSLWATTSLELSQTGSTRPFCLVSIPKSGTHLNAKLLAMLTNRTLFTLDYVDQIHKNDYPAFEQFLLNRYNNNEFVRCHTYSPGTLPISRILNFVCDHQEYLAILAVRDLRDVIVSYAYFATENFNRELGPNHTMDDRLEHILCRMGGVAGNLENCVKGVINNWLTPPNVLIVPFEDLVGVNGGGSDLKQQEVIEKVASNLGMALTDDDLKKLCENLFGNSYGPPVSVTFREGKIGSWKKHFKPHHIELFKKNWAGYQYALGYDLDGMD